VETRAMEPPHAPEMRTRSRLAGNKGEGEAVCAGAEDEGDGGRRR
jgi:hypothetical protein